MAAELITDVDGSGNETPHADWLDLSTDFFSLRPSLTVATVPCGLVLAAGTGTVTGSATFRRAWR
jgi:hypothetical protein